MLQCKLYIVACSFKQWEHYLHHNSFVLYSNHKALQYLKSQKTLGPMHARWITFLDTFIYIFHHKTRSTNQVASALSCKSSIFTIITIQIQDFDTFKKQYLVDEDFGPIWLKCIYHELVGACHIFFEFLFHGTQLCMP